jgi:hypothetical protein
LKASDSLLGVRVSFYQENLAGIDLVT